jgi:DNA-binding NtrC family response regulator
MVVGQQAGLDDTGLSLDAIRIKVEKQAILQALTKAGGNKSVAAESLGIDRSVLYDKIKKYGIG